MYRYRRCSCQAERRSQERRRVVRCSDLDCRQQAGGVVCHVTGNVLTFSTYCMNTCEPRQIPADTKLLSANVLRESAMFCQRAVVEELQHQAESTAVNSEPSFEHVHEDRMVDGVEGG